MEQLGTRQKKLALYEQQIVQWLQDFPGLSAAQISDWLKEHHPQLQVGESTVRAYVRALRNQYGIPKTVKQRQYEAVPDPPMGKQMQVDFGVTKMKNLNGIPVKLWFITFVLSHSRYKFVHWQDRPFVTQNVIHAHEQAFAYHGGMPEEIVYDQDHLLLVSENYGEFILTHEFASYVCHCGFQVHMCRKRDPESKGRVENVVKYVKQNFARHRIFKSVDKLNEDCLAWLDRTGNALVHHTTKKIPAEVFALERQHLRPVHQKIQKAKSTTIRITRTVRKDNTIWFAGNQYSVPLGTYDGTATEVGVQADETKVHIVDLRTGALLAEHARSFIKGQLIQNTNHRRDRKKGIDAYLESVIMQFTDTQTAKAYLEAIHRRYPRYIRDQLQLIQKTLSQSSQTASLQALRYCMAHGLYRATDFADAVQYFQATLGEAQVAASDVPPVSGVDPAKWKAKPQMRDLEVYQRILRGG